MGVDADGTIFGELMPSPAFHPCSLTDRASVSYTDCAGSIPAGGTFQLFVAVFLLKPFLGLVWFIALLDLGRAFLVS